MDFTNWLILFFFGGDLGIDLLAREDCRRGRRRTVRNSVLAGFRFRRMPLFVQLGAPKTALISGRAISS